MKSFTMAWRNVWRNGRRTLAAVLATSLGLLAMIVYAGLVTGFRTNMERNMLDLEMGDVQVFHPEYRKTPSIHERIEDPAALLAALDDAGLAAAPRLLGSGLAAAGTSSAGVSLRGIDIARDARVGRIAEHVKTGEWLDAGDPSGIVIGRRLAQMLGVGIGDEIVLLSQGADGSTANDLYAVRGVLGGVSDAVDRGGVFMVEAAFRQLLVVPEGVHQIIVRRGDRTLDDAAAVVRDAAPDLDVRTWRELQPTLASMLDSSEGGMMAMFVIVYVAIGIVILNAMLMAVFERIREFGVLKALGVGPFGVLQLILLETVIQVGVAIAIAVTLAIPANAYLSTQGIDLTSVGSPSVMGVVTDPVWRSQVSLSTYVQPIVVLLVIVSLAVVYPALRAALIRPIEAMRTH